MTNDSITLCERFVEGIDEYFGNDGFSEHRLLAFAINPVLATLGAQDIILYLGNNDGSDLVQKMKRLLRGAVRKLATELLEKEANENLAAPAEEEDELSDLEMDDDLDPLERVEKARARAAAATSNAATATSSPEELINTAVDTWFDQVFDAEAELKAQRQRMNKTCDDIDWERVRRKEALYISSVFNLCEWWKCVGRDKYRLVFLTVPSILSVPSANDFQERVFSTCTWFDDPLRQRMKYERYEMSVLLAVNEELLRCKVPSDDETEEIVENVLSMFEESLGTNAKEYLEQFEE